MEDVFSKRFEEWRRGDGHRAINPSFVWLTLGAALIVILSWYAFTPIDTLLAYAPRDSGVYIHENRDRGSRFIPIPENMTPDESALFALLDENLEPVWSTMLAWHSPARMTASEIDALATAGARAVDHGVWILGFQGADGVDQAMRGGQSLGQDQDVARSLGLMRSVMNLQGYVNFNLVPPDALTDALAPFHSLPPTVFGLASSRTLLRFAAQPLADAASASLALGFGATGNDDGRGLMTTKAAVSFTSDTAVIDPITLLFSSVEEMRILSDIPENDAYDAATDHLRRLMNTQTDIVMLNAGDELSLQPVAKIQKIHFDELKSAIEAFVNIALPESVEYPLPDSDLIDEYRTPIMPATFEQKAPDWYELNDEIRNITIVLAKDNSGAAIIGGSEEIVRAAMNNTTSGSAGCLPGNYTKQLSINVTALQRVGLKSALIGETVDNTVIGCGLRQ